MAGNSAAFKALADENRMLILRLLLRRNCCVRALSRQLDISEAAVSQHLKVLREAGLILGEKSGYFTHYTVNRSALQVLADALSAMGARGRMRTLHAAARRVLGGGIRKMPQRGEGDAARGRKQSNQLERKQRYENCSHLPERTDLPALRPLRGPSSSTPWKTTRSCRARSSARSAAATARLRAF